MHGFARILVACVLAVGVAGCGDNLSDAEYAWCSQPANQAALDAAAKQLDISVDRDHVYEPATSRSDPAFVKACKYAYKSTANGGENLPNPNQQP
jgi:hypothetical protein